MRTFDSLTSKTTNEGLQLNKGNQVKQLGSFENLELHKKFMKLEELAAKVKKNTQSTTLSNYQKE